MTDRDIILQTRLQYPYIKGKILSRRRLIDVLCQNLDKKLIIISGEAGYSTTRRGTNADLLMTGKIELAHLNEFADYYDRLEEMEEEAEKFRGEDYSIIASAFTDFPQPMICCSS